MLIKKYLVIAAVALIAAGCGGGGANSLFTAPGGTVEGNVYVSSYNSAGAARTAGREAGAAPGGYTAVANASVTIASQNLSTTTDANGLFSLADVRPGAVTIKITKAGMEDLSITANVAEGATTNLNNSTSNASLTMAPASHGTLVVTTTAGGGLVSVPVTGAAVLINNVNTNKTTMATISDILLLDPAAPGYTPYTVTVTAPGYNSVLPQTAAITTNTPNVALNFVLVPTDGNNAPYSNIATPADGATFSKGSNVTFTGAGTDPEDGNLTGASLAWTSDRDGALGTGGTLRTTTLSPGKHKITLTATDSKGKTGTASVEITITDVTATNAAPTATIFTPVNNSTVTTSQTITFTGAGTDAEDGALTGTSLVWTSNRDGKIGTGTNIQKSGLSAGIHVITLTATDAGGLTDTDTVTITVNQASTANTAPTAVIATPADGATGTTNTRFTFSGTGIDNEDGTLTGDSVVWKSSRDGQIGTGNYFTRTLTAGTHVITQTVTDSKGLTGSSSVTVIVTQSATANTAPAAVIATPASGATATVNTTINFTGTGIDTEDGNLTGTALSWTSNKDGLLGTGALVSKKLSAGTHTITLTATDAQGMSGSDSITVVISGTNDPPQVTIISPVAGAVALSVTAVNFVGAALDPEDGNLTGSSLVWKSSKDGTLGTGNYFSATLSAGTHTITLTATDSNGLSASATRSVTVR